MNGCNCLIKYLIDIGSDVNGVWSPESMKYRIHIFTLINNFNDPFYQRHLTQDEIPVSQINILIENGMI